MFSFIDWDEGYAEAARVVKDLPLQLVRDTGDKQMEQAPCGCTVWKSCSHPSSVHLCPLHGKH